MNTNLNRRSVWCIVLGVVLLVSAGAGSVAADHGTTEATFDENTTPTDQLRVLAMDDGSATIMLATTYEFSSAEEREAFESLAGDEQAQSSIETNFESRMSSVANQTDGASPDDVHSPDSRVYTVETDNGTVGVIELWVTWDGLGEVQDDGSVVISEPFSSGFNPDRTVVLSAPHDDGVVTAVQPDTVTISDDGSQAMIPADADINGFEATISFTESSDGMSSDSMDSDSETDTSTPGLTAVTGVVAIGAFAVYLTTRRFRDT